MKEDIIINQNNHTIHESHEVFYNVKKVRLVYFDSSSSGGYNQPRPIEVRIKNSCFGWKILDKKVLNDLE